MPHTSGISRKHLRSLGIVCQRTTCEILREDLTELGDQCWRVDPKRKRESEINIANQPSSQDAFVCIYFDASFDTFCLPFSSSMLQLFLEISNISEK